MIHPSPNTKHAHNRATLGPFPVRGVAEVFDYPMTWKDPRRDAPAGRLYARRAGHPCTRRAVCTRGGRDVSTTQGGVSTP